MNKELKLRQIKLLHTAIWAVMVAAIACILYGGFSGQVTALTYSAMALIGLEVATLLINRWTCPLTPIARQFSDSPKPNFDIYLPEWLAKWNKAIFGTMTVLGLLLVAWRLLKP
jgi:hypothetical protein